MQGSYDQDNVLFARSPVTDAKAIKNNVELSGFRECHIRDGVALARYFAWLEETLDAGKTISESEGADKLEQFRSLVLRLITSSTCVADIRHRRELDLFKGLSFTTISSTGPNAGELLP